MIPSFVQVPASDLRPGDVFLDIEDGYRCTAVSVERHPVTDSPGTPMWEGVTEEVHVSYITQHGDEPCDVCPPSYTYKVLR